MASQRIFESRKQRLKELAGWLSLPAVVVAGIGWFLYSAKTPDDIITLTPSELVNVVNTPSKRPNMAFPEAYGFGAKSVGGRGDGNVDPKIVHVTTLEDYHDTCDCNGDGVCDKDDPNTPQDESEWTQCLADANGKWNPSAQVIVGSLRWALNVEKGPRIIVFDVGGTINLKGKLTVTNNSYITIAGQSAPGGGIQIANGGIYLNGCHDIVIRYLRIRPGVSAPIDSDAFSTNNNVVNGQMVPSYNIIVDHCSLQWSIDENIDIWGNSYQVTIQRCLISEGSLEGHSYGTPHSCAFLSGGSSSQTRDDRLTLHHNLISNCSSRNPQLTDNGGITEFINNVVYNWEYYGMLIRESGSANTPRVNIINNLFIKGPAQLANVLRRPITVDPNVNDNSIYVSGNFGDRKGNWLVNDWEMVGDNLSSEGSSVGILNPIKRRNEPWPINNIYKVCTEYAFALSVWNDVGANYPELDAVDKRLINEAKTGQGTIGFGTGENKEKHPVIAGGTKEQDTDNDGMPDKWEVLQGLNPEDSSDAILDNDDDGYLNIEEYLNSLK